MCFTPRLGGLRAHHGLGPDLREGRPEARRERPLRAQQGSGGLRFGALLLITSEHFTPTVSRHPDDRTPQSASKRRRKRAA